VADTTRPRLVWEVPYYPAYYVPLADVRTDLLVATATVTHSPRRGQAQHFTIKAGGKAAVDAALRYADSPIPELRDLIRLDWDRDRSPPRPRQAMIRVGPCRSFSAWQRMRLTRVRPTRCHHVGSADPGHPRFWLLAWPRRGQHAK
jgi:Domain of unknown function (DUF427)